MRAHVFRCNEGWGAYTKGGELFTFGAVEDSFETALAKIEELPEREELWTRVTPGHRGLSITLNISHHCNLRCIYCYAEDGTYGMGKELMSPSMARRALNMFAAQPEGISELRFFGGEPLLNLPAMEAALSQLSARTGLKERKVGVVTNGTLIGEEFIELCREYSISVTVSLDGPKEVHDLLRVTPRGTGSHEDTLRGLGRLLEALPQNFVRCEATYTGLHERAGFSREDVLSYIRSLGVPLGYVVDYMGHDASLRCANQAVDESLAYSRKMLDGLLADSPTSDFDAVYLLGKLVARVYHDYMCPAGVSTFLVTPDGSIYPCNLLVASQFKMGSIHNPEFRATPEYRAVRGDVEKGSNISRDPRCQDCWIQRLCGGCPARRFHLSGRFALPDGASCDGQRAAVEQALAWVAHTSQDGAEWSKLIHNLKELLGERDIVQAQRAV